MENRSYRKSRRSACVSSEFFVEVNTNEHGVLQVHPCRSANCAATFVFSVNDDEWIQVTDEVLCDRLNAAVQEAVKDKHSGFHSYHSVYKW